MEKQTCKDQVMEHLKGRIEDLEKLFEACQKGDEEVEGLGTFNEYGLAFDYVAPGTFDYVAPGTFQDQKRGYFRYQLSWGGPSDEFRFYTDENFNPVRIEYWFMDWYDGAKIILKGTSHSLLMDIWGSFQDCGTVEAEFQKAKE